MGPLQPSNKLSSQRALRYEESQLQEKDFMRDPINLLPQGKDMLQETRIALFVDSPRKSSYNTNNTPTDVLVMNMPCSSLGEMIEVTCQIFTPAAAEFTPFPTYLTTATAQPPCTAGHVEIL